MSKHHHSHNRIWSDIQHLSTAELEELYDIHVEEDGTVWDTLEHKGFDSLTEWAAYTESLEDEYDGYETSGKKHYFDDE